MLDHLASTAPCWETIGVRGDHSCPTLAEVTHCRNCPVYAAAGRALADRPPPEGYTAEWTARVAEPDEPPRVATIAVILFRVGEEWYALDVACAIEVVQMLPVRRVPHQSRPALRGLVNFRGELQLAVSLAGLLGATQKEPQRLLVIERGPERWAVLADEVHDILRLPETEMGSVPATVSAGGRPLTRGVFRWRDHTVGWLDPARLFTALAGALA